MSSAANEITQNRISEILRLVFDLLWFEPDGLYAREIMDKVRSKIQPTEYESDRYPFAPQFPRYELIIRIGTIALEKAGWLVKTQKGRWYITDKGREVSKEYLSADAFFEEAIRQYLEWKTNEQERWARITSIPRFHPEEKAWEQIEQFVQSMDPSDFKFLAGELLQALGYYLAWTAPKENNSGIIDFIALTDPIGVKSPRILVHVNHKGQVTTLQGYQDFLGAIRADEHGILISSGGFTAKVKEAVLTLPNRNIRLIDLETFMDLLIKHRDKLTPEVRDRIPLKAVYFLSLPDW
jgi:restriction system protein